MSTPPRKAILIRTPQDVLDAIDAEKKRAEARRPGHRISRNAVMLRLLRRGLRAERKPGVNPGPQIDPETPSAR